MQIVYIHLIFLEETYSLSINLKSCKKSFNLTEFSELKFAYFTFDGDLV